jgi:hypothetical protein
MLGRIKTNFKEKLFSTIIHVNVKLKEAQNEGLPILNYDKYCRGAKDYFSLAREIITQEKTTSVSLVLEKKMKEILKEKLPQISQVVFSVKAPEAKEVYVVGDFNNWKLDESSRMQRTEDSWRKIMKLGAGRYHYRFVVDGNWIEDNDNPAKEMNPYGSMDSLIEVNTSK